MKRFLLVGVCLVIIHSTYGQGQQKITDFAENTNAKADIQLVVDYLSYLSKGDSTSVISLLSPVFYSFSPDTDNPSYAEATINEWKELNRRFINQEFIWSETASIVITDFRNRGTWVLLRGTWSARDRQTREMLVMPLQQLSKLKDGKIAVARVSIGEEHLTSDDRLPLYQLLRAQAKGPVAIIKKQK